MQATPNGISSITYNFDSIIHMKSVSMNKKLQKISRQINLNNIFLLNLFIHFAGPQGLPLMKSNLTTPWLFQLLRILKSRDIQITCYDEVETGLHSLFHKS